MEILQNKRVMILIGLGVQMLNACPEHPDISHALRTGEPLEVKYPERDDVVEVDVAEIRNKQMKGDTYES